MPKKTNLHHQHYLLYARKSDKDPQNQKNSIQYQVTEGVQFARKHGLTIANFSLDYFCERGIIKERHTAFKTSEVLLRNDGTASFQIERPKFQQMVQCLTRRQFAGVICLCWDRISRNDQDAMLVKQLMAQGVDMRFVQTQYDESSSGSLHMDIDSIFAKYYSRVISEKVKAAYAQLVSEGQSPHRAPIGYLDEGPDNKQLDPERAPLIKRIFELYATGEWSLHQLAKWANQQGLTTKPMRRRRTQEEMLAVEENELPQESRPVSHKTIEHTLKNPYYIGKRWSQGKVVDGAHPALINVSLFNQVQDVLSSKSVSIHYVDKEFFTYRGLVHCSCGRVYTPYRKKGIVYYRSRCKEECDNPVRNLSEAAIDAVIEDVLGQIHFSEEELADITAQAETELVQVAHARNAALEDLEAQRKRIYADLDYLKQHKVAILRHAAMGPAEYRQDVARLEGELEEVHRKMEVYRQSEKEMLQYVLTFSELVKNARIYYKSALDTEKRDICSEVFSELVLYGGKVAQVKAKEGFAALFKRHFGNNGGPPVLFSELLDVYFQVKISLQRMRKQSYLNLRQSAKEALQLA